MDWALSSGCQLGLIDVVLSHMEQIEVGERAGSTLCHLF